MKKTETTKLLPTPQEGIVRAVLSKRKANQPISKEQKIQFRNCLEWVIENEKNKETLAWAYNLRGLIYSGNYPDLCE